MTDEVLTRRPFALPCLFAHVHALVHTCVWQLYVNHALAAGFIATVEFSDLPAPVCSSSKYGGDCSVDYCLGTKHLTGKGDVTAEYRNNAECGWLITPTDPTNVVVVEFEVFDTEIGEDYVTIYDGPTTASDVLGRFSGDTFPPTIVGTQASLLVTFTSDNMIHAGKNFKFVYDEVATTAPIVCEKGRFGHACDSNVCFGSTR